MTYTLHLGDNRELLAKMKPNTVDAIVTDPPYGLEFMGKDWDHGVPGVHFWQEAIRVAKPGAHLLAFGGSRTFHRLAVAIEDAGWEIRDTIMWVYGSGFPKSLDVSKAIDAAAGAEREMVGTGTSGKTRQVLNAARYPETFGGDFAITAPATPEAAAWQGFGTALKPAHEPIIVARKPLEGTVAQNVLKWGTGAINVDGCRVGTETVENGRGGRGLRDTQTYGKYNGQDEKQYVSGRWPANLVHDGSAEVLRLFPVTTSGGPSTEPNPHQGNSRAGLFSGRPGFKQANPDKEPGSAARFFYCAKASKQDRDEGLEGWTQRNAYERDGRKALNVERRTDGSVRAETRRSNNHPTVKPTALMKWLVRLVTPPGGVVLDPFAGSGSTGKAAMLEGFDFIGVELDPEYLEIARARIEFAIADQAFGLFDVPELDMAAD